MSECDCKEENAGNAKGEERASIDVTSAKCLELLSPPTFVQIIYISADLGYFPTFFPLQRAQTSYKKAPQSKNIRGT